jgi:hypothetical protein
MKMYDIFRRGKVGFGPLWIKGEENLEVAKLEAMRLAANDGADYFVMDLATSKILCDTQELPRAKRAATS